MYCCTLKPIIFNGLQYARPVYCWTEQRASSVRYRTAHRTAFGLSDRTWYEVRCNCCALAFQWKLVVSSKVLAIVLIVRRKRAARKSTVGVQNTRFTEQTEESQLVEESYFHSGHTSKIWPATFRHTMSKRPICKPVCTQLSKFNIFQLSEELMRG